MSAREAPRSMIEHRNLEHLETLRDGDFMVIPALHDPGASDPLVQLGIERTPDSFISTGALFGQENQDRIIQRLSELPYEETPILVDAYRSLINIYSQSSNNKEFFQKLEREIYASYFVFMGYVLTGKLSTTQQGLDFTAAIRSAKLNNIGVEHKIITLPAAYVGFAVDGDATSQKGTNKQSYLAEFMRNLTTGNYRGTFSALCAQYEDSGDEHASESTNLLVDDIEEPTVARAMKWQDMLTMVPYLEGKTKTGFWSTLKGSKDFIQSIIPTVVIEYGNNNQLAKMLLLLDRHFYQLQSLARRIESRDRIIDIGMIERATETRLIELLGNDWYKIQLDNVIGLLESLGNNKTFTFNQALGLQALNDTKKTINSAMARFYENATEMANVFEARAQNLQDDLINLSSREWAEWCSYHNWNPNSDRSIALPFLNSVKDEIIHQGRISNTARAMHEAILYQEIGRFCARNKLLPIGLDIDHTLWQSDSIMQGYKVGIDETAKKPITFYRQGGILFKDGYPIAYARKPNIHITKEEKAQGITHAMKLKLRGAHLLKNFWLREEWKKLVNGNH